MGDLNWLLVLGVFMAVGWVANYWAHSQTFPLLQYLGLGLYTLAEAILVLPLLAIAISFFLSPHESGAGLFAGVGLDYCVLADRV